MPLPGLIILIVTILAFVVAGTVAAVWGWRPKLPSGHKFEAEFAGKKLILIVEDDIPTISDRVTGQVTGWAVGGDLFKGEDLAQKAAIAMSATELAFKEKGIANANIKKYVVHFQSDNRFETFNQTAWWQNWAKGVAAYTNRIRPNWFGPATPGCVVRAKHMKALTERGQPVVHELIHTLNDVAGNGSQRSHNNEDLWNSFGSNTVEAIGVRQWKDLIESLKNGK